MKYTIIRSNRLNIFGSKMNTEDSRVENMFSEMNPLLKILLEIFLKIHCIIPAFMFNSRLKGLDADIIIVFDGHTRKEFLKWLADYNPGKRLIFWCWNTVEEIEQNIKLEDIPNIYEKWSYSCHDCEKYSLSYNTTFYWNMDSSLESSNIYQDIYFIGKDKGRLAKIIAFEELCKRENLKVKFHVVPTHFYNRDKYYKKNISYAEVMREISHSRAILDMKVSETAGPSLRALEAAFYCKKLVTDDIGVKTFRFYNPHNVFIINDPEEKRSIHTFLSEEYDMSGKVDIDYYNFLNWMNRFQIEE